MKKLLIGLLLGMGVVMGVQAEDVGVNIDGKNIVVTETTNAFGSDESRLDSKDFPSGIFIQASTINGEILLNATEVIKSRFFEKGFKVVSSIDEADIAIGFISLKSLDMKNADQEVEHSLLPTANQIATGLGGSIGSTIVLGPVALAGYLAGTLFSDETAIIGGVSCLKPVYGTAHGKKYIYSSLKKNGEQTNSVKISYKLDKENKASDAIVLKMVIDQWIERYMINNTLSDKNLSAP